MDKKRVRVAIYTRVSTLDQAREGTSLDSQLSSLKAYINNKGESNWLFDENLVYKDEGVSGADEHRPGLDKMKRDIELGLIDVVLIWKIDRLFRKTEYLLQIVNFFKEHNVTFASKMDNIDTESSTGRLMLTILGAIAEMERSLISERTMLGKLAKAGDGFYVGGEPPYGYKKNKFKKLVVNEEEAKIVKKIFDLYVKEKKSQTEIARILTSEKVPNKASSMKTKKNMPEFRKNNWRQEHISTILSRPHYIGHYYYNQVEYKKNEKNGKKETRARPESEWIEISCPVIIKNKNLYDEALRLSSQNKNNAKKEDNYRYLLAGILFCGDDGCERAFGGYKTGKGTRGYRCKGKNKDGRKVDGIKCDNPEISASQVEGLAWDSILKLIDSPKNFEKYLIKKTDTDKKLLGLREELDILEKKKIERKEDLKNAIYSMRGKSGSSIEAYEIITKEIDDELKTIDNRINEVNLAIDGELNKSKLLLTFNKISEEYKLKLKLIEKDRDRMYDIIHKFIYKIIITKKEIEIYFQFNKEQPGETISRLKKNIDKNSYSLGGNVQKNTKNIARNSYFFVIIIL